MAVALATAQDFSRSMMLVLPVGLLGAVFALEARPRWFPGTLRAAAAAALLLPGHLVMSNGAVPVLGFTTSSRPWTTRGCVDAGTV